MTVKNKPEEEIEEFKERFKKIDPDNLLDMVVEILNIYGSFVEKFGSVQKKYASEFELFDVFAKRPLSPEIINMIVDKASPETAGIMLKIMLKLNTITPQMNRLMELSAREKIELGKTIKSIAKDFSKLKTEGS